MSISYDSADEWEVVDIVRTSSDTIPHPEVTGSVPSKEQAANKKDVDQLANDIKQQLNVKNAEQTQKLLMLQAKIQHQQKMSEQQMEQLQLQLFNITHLHSKEREKAVENENKSKVKQNDQQRQIQAQQKQLSSLQSSLKKQQRLLKNQNAIVQQTKNQQKQQELINAQHHAQALQQAQISAVTANANTNTNNSTSMPMLSPLQPLQSLHSLHSLQPLNNGLPTLPSLPPLKNHNHSNNSNSNINNNNNGSWFPSFLTFDNHGGGGHQPPPPPLVQPTFDFTPAVPHNTGLMVDNTTNNIDLHHPPRGMIHHHHHSAEEKANTLDDDNDDDNMVLTWTNDHGINNPLINNPGLLKTKQVIGEGDNYQPGEGRQCGWLLQNNSGVKLLQLTCTLNEETNENERHSVVEQQRCEMKCIPEKLYEFTLAPKEEIFILLEVIAPACVGKYCKFFQLRMINGGYQIGEILEVVCNVSPVFNEEKERKIEQIVKMGFYERKTIVKMLKHFKWNVEKAVNKMVTT